MGYDVAVLVGRFQPWHVAHAGLLRQALGLARRCVVVLGSAFAARSAKNPWTWAEREAMISASLSPQERARVTFVPVRDYYNEPKWIAAVRAQVEATQTGQPRVALVGHEKDASSAYLKGFAGWDWIAVERLHVVDATSVRAAYFDDELNDVARWAQIGAQVPASTLQYLQDWRASEAFAWVRAEWQALQAARAAWVTAPYPPVFVTVDALVTCRDHVLLVRRGRTPGLGLWALPGGFVEQHETLALGVVRELFEETGLTVTLAQLNQPARVFDHPGRSLRGRTITHVFRVDWAFWESDSYFDSSGLPVLKAGDDAQAALWFPLARLSEIEDRLLDDHFHIVTSMLMLPK